MAEWIHVDDRLPDTENTMFVFVQYPGDSGIAGVTLGQLYEGKWTDPDSGLDLDSYEAGGVGLVVTHWRPYVTPPHPTTGIL